jgi:hypothetical protein
MVVEEGWTLNRFYRVKVGLRGHSAMRALPLRIGNQLAMRHSSCVSCIIALVHNLTVPHYG